MKTLSSFIFGLVVGIASGYFYVAVQNTYSVAYTNGAVEAMSKVCPALTDKLKAQSTPQQK